MSGPVLGNDDRPRGTRAQEAQIRAIIDHLADGIVIVGETGAILWANTAAESLFARSTDSLLGTDFGFAIAGDVPVEIEVIRPGGVTVTAELRATDLPWEGVPARLVSIRDITDRRRAEERSRQVERERAARAEAEAANKAKNEFLATMSHELRTPLNAVIGYAQLLEIGVGGTLPPAQQPQVRRILESARHLLGLVNELLDVAKVDAGRLTVQKAPAASRSAVDASVALVQPSAEPRGISITAARGGTSDVWYIGDEDRVRQILVNLLTNGVKFTEAGGSVRLEYGDAPRAGAEALIGDGPVAYMSVTDTGVGISSDDLSRIFEPFVQVDSGHTRSNEGSGLGLAISRKLARLMNGDITVESRVGSGSTFTLWLPLATGAIKKAAVSSITATAVTPPLHGVGDIGRLMFRCMEALLDNFVSRLRAECAIPGAEQLTYASIADHIACYIADVASMLVALEEAGGQPLHLIAEAAELHRFIAVRHGAQRARLGWSEAMIRCEYRVLGEEIDRTVRAREESLGAATVDEALATLEKLLAHAEDVSIRALLRNSGESDGAPNLSGADLPA